MSAADPVKEAALWVLSVSLMAVFAFLAALLLLSPWYYWTNRAQDTFPRTRRQFRVDAIAGLEAFLFIVVAWAWLKWRVGAKVFPVMPEWLGRWWLSILDRHRRRVQGASKATVVSENTGKYPTHCRDRRQK